MGKVKERYIEGKGKKEKVKAITCKSKLCEVIDRPNTMGFRRVTCQLIKFGVRGVKTIMGDIQKYSK